MSWSPGLKQQSNASLCWYFSDYTACSRPAAFFLFFLASLIVTGVKNTIGRHNGVDKTYGRGLEDEAAVGSFSCKNYSRLCQCDFHSVSHCCLYIEASAAVPVSSVSPNCFLEEGRWKGASLFYIYTSMGRDGSSMVEVKRIESGSMKCHLVHMGAVTETTPQLPPPKSPSPIPIFSPVINEKVLHRGRPSIVAV